MKLGCLNRYKTGVEKKSGWLDAKDNMRENRSLEKGYKMQKKTWKTHRTYVK